MGTRGRWELQEDGNKGKVGTRGRWELGRRELGIGGN